MPKIQYKKIKFHKATIDMIDHANEIVREYQAQELDLTVRQLFYQFVSRDLIPNTEKWYEKIGKTINDARLTGLMDWDAIVDRTRRVKTFSYWESPREILQEATDQYRIDKWAYQPYYPEVWIEKDALIGVIEGVCSDLEVPYFACRGYNSQSNMWEAGHKRLSNRWGTPVIIYLGDHDPSGLDMGRDIEARLNMFLNGTKSVVFERIALNMDQVEQFRPPPNPTKLKDTRAKNYPYNESWELDALDPREIVRLVRDSVKFYLNDETWRKELERQEKHRNQLQTLIDKTY